MIFAEKTAHLLLAKIKEKIGCSICKNQNDPLELMLWDHENTTEVDDEEVILMKHEDVLGMSGVCLECIIRVREIEVPKIGRPRELH
jgi:hypothetical protein